MSGQQLPEPWYILKMKVQKIWHDRPEYMKTMKPDQKLKILLNFSAVHRTICTINGKFLMKISDYIGTGAIMIH
jgi:hypothetical protein